MFSGFSMHDNILLLKGDIREHSVCVTDIVIAWFIVSCTAVKVMYWQPWSTF